MSSSQASSFKYDHKPKLPDLKMNQKASFGAEAGLDFFFSRGATWNSTAEDVVKGTSSGLPGRHRDGGVVKRTLPCRTREEKRASESIICIETQG